ncbi:hypothetical protein CTI14_45935, partial [Methylobacterium radiotolerans]
MPNQIRFNQKLDGIEGSVLFSYNDMKPSDLAALPADQQPKHQAKNTAIELLEGEAFAHPTLVPAKPWPPAAAPRSTWGMRLYKHVNNGGWEQAWMNPEEVPNQIRFNQKLDGIEGSVLFSYNDMKPSDLA